MAEVTLDDRLKALSAKIDSAESELRNRDKWQDQHRLTAGELRARHAFLKGEINETMSKESHHGKRVTLLEREVEKWVDELDL